MNVTCQECRSVFRVDPGKVPWGGVRARCSECGAVIAVAAPDGRATPGAARPAVPAAPSPATPAAMPASPAPAATPRPFGQPAPAPAPRPGVTAPPAARPPLAGPRPPAPTPPIASAVDARPAAAPSPAALAPAAPAAPAAGNVTPAGAPAASMDSGRRSINPFLANDPNQKARRLARALVSDMVTYLPQKREEGLRQGTLKTLFREEIKKSYEEYVEQIGREVAESTPHFQEALNDILAGGRKVF